MQALHSSASPDFTSRAESLLEIVRAILRELHPNVWRNQPVALDTRLDRELGLDSLAMTELICRVERDLDVCLPDEALAAETPRELLRHVLAAHGSARPERRDTPAHAARLDDAQLPSRAETLLDVLEWHAARHANRAHVWLYETPDQVLEVTCERLARHARKIAAGLCAAGMEAGDGVAIMLPTSRAYLYSFFGILLAGGVPVPIYPPARWTQIEEHVRRAVKVLHNARAVILITVPETERLAGLIKAHVPDLRRVLTVEELAASPAAGAAVSPVRAQDIALLQYTSGSTGDPKGVVLTHANLLANIRSMVQRARVDSADTFVSWLPLYHDMGLIGAWLGSLYIGAPLVLMSPVSFLARPARWLWAIDHHRGTFTASPNFGYELCLKKISDQELEGLDLGSLRLAFNGAEPVSPATVRNFEARFKRYGLADTALMAVYGMAEGSLGITIPPPGHRLVIDRIRRDAFMRSGRAEPAADGEPDALKWVGCGEVLSGEELRIVDPSGNELPDRQEGRVEFRGPSATAGYFSNPDATRRLFRHSDWLDSGDRGYLANGQLFITGRDKDVIIRAGRNIFPYELDEAIGKLAGIRKGCVATFGVRDASPTERIVIVAETNETDAAKLQRLRDEIIETAIEIVTFAPDDVVLVPAHTILKTSSGKIRRAATRRLYENGDLGRRRKVPWQLVLLAVTSVRSLLSDRLARTAALLYSGYAWTLFYLFAIPTTVAILLLPRLRWRWQVARAAARLLAGCIGNRVVVDGIENLPAKPFVLVANHQSYLDSFSLVVALPSMLSFVAKAELTENPLLKVLLTKLGVLFVRRFDIRESSEDAARLVELVKAHRTMAFFPEGTFRRGAGLLGFHMGAFVAAAAAGMPVVPVAIRGTRCMMRGGPSRMHRGIARIVVASPIIPPGSDWQAALALRDQARRTILAHCGDPDLAAE